MEKLSNINIAPWIQKATRLRGKSRTVGGNQFRHQGKTMFILIDYLIIDSVLLKASVIHDLFEEFYYESFKEFLSIDFEGEQVVELVFEVTRKRTENGLESKNEFLNRIRLEGSKKARLLKCADRISNLTDLNSDFENKFIRRYMKESRDIIMPMAKKVDSDMYKEIKDIMENLEKSTGIRVL